MIEISETVTLVVVTCPACGTPFGIESNRNTSLRRSGDTFYCPNGHTQVYTDTMQKKLDQLHATVKTLEADKKFYKDEAERKAKQLSSTKGVLTRTKNRIAKGVCPCCNRQFVNLHRHMEGQHPGYLTEKNNE